MNMHRPIIKGFTLVELLVTISIIAILASMTLVALSSAREQARVFRTRSTILKIETAIAEIYERYDDRNIGRNDLSQAATDYINEPATGWQFREKQMFLMAKRDLIRKEMPHNWFEVMDFYTPSGYNDPGYTLLYDPQPTVHRYYQMAYVAAKTRSGSDDTVLENGSAELLYLIIANMNPEALAQFGPGEIGDTDGDGLLEFIDSWGKPIQFLRWAPGLIDSDIQPVVYQPNAALKSLGAIEAFRSAAPDPLDKDGCGVPYVTSGTANFPRIVQISDETNWQFGQGWWRGWFIYPLIVSGGPDGEVGLHVARDPKLNDPKTNSFLGNATSNYVHTTNPYLGDNTIENHPRLLGAPSHSKPHASKDNIHNHSRQR